MPKAVELFPGQRVTLNVQPVEGIFADPVVWSHNSAKASIVATLNPTQGNETQLYVPANSPTGSFKVVAQSGDLHSECMVFVRTVAKDMEIVIGSPS